MKKFAKLYQQLDETNRSSEKVEALKTYFSDAPPRDAAWAFYFLSGNKVARAVNAPSLRLWGSQASGYPAWLVDECYEAVGDLGETLALILPDHDSTSEDPLHLFVKKFILPLRQMAEIEKRETIFAGWRQLDRYQRFIWHKLIMGSFRVGVSRTLVVKALSQIANVEPAIMAHRTMGHYEPTEEDFTALLSGETLHSEIARPYPFFLAHAVEREVESLGSVADFQAEWKWDGIRAQLIRRGNEVMVWSRGEDLLTDRFPEIAGAGHALPSGTVVDGEIVAWNGNAPGPFQELQKRITRKSLTPAILKAVPAWFLVYDIMEHQGADVRFLPLSERRILLENLIADLPSGLPIGISSTHTADSWEQLAQLRETSRENFAEGLMLKRLSSPYGVGRTKGHWYKWKIDPYSIDAVLTYAQRGHGRRASLYTDYTFGIWDDGDLVTIAKAYSGLTDKEIQQVDAFVRQNTLDRFGPVRQVRPELVFELAFEGIQHNPRNKSKLAVRFPRIARWRHDKKPQDADTLERMRALINSPTGKD